MGLRLLSHPLIAALTLSAPLLAAVESAGLPPLGVMRRVPLQSGIPYEIGIGTMPTTIMMHAPIEAFQSEGITTTDRQIANVFLDHTPGTRFFSVKALAPGVADLNVLCHGEFYSFRFFLSSNPTRTLTILPPDSSSAKSFRPALTPQRLYGLLQDAKTYFLVAQAQPGFSRDLQVAAPGTIQAAGTHRVVLDQVFRFEKDDTLCFRVIFLNDTFSALRYNPEQIAIRIGTDVHRPSFADLSGEMSPARPGTLVWRPSRPNARAILVGPDSDESDVSDALTIPLTKPGRYRLQLSAPGVKTQEFPFDVDRLNEPKTADVAPFPVSGKDSLLGTATLTQPRTGQSFGYILISGMPDGRRGEISIENEFKFLIYVQPPAS